MARVGGLEGSGFKLVRLGEGCVTPAGGGQFITGHLWTLSRRGNASFYSRDSLCCTLVLGQKMEHFCLYVLLIHLPGDERGRKNFFFLACDSHFFSSPKRVKGIKNSAKCRKND